MTGVQSESQEPSGGGEGLVAEPSGAGEELVAGPSGAGEEQEKEKPRMMGPSSRTRAMVLKEAASIKLAKAAEDTEAPKAAEAGSSLRVEQLEKGPPKNGEAQVISGSSGNLE